MKKVVLISSVLIYTFLLASCEKCETSDCQLIPAKIIRYDCDRVIFQLLTEENIGDAQWQDTRSGIRYNNVVSYYNTCRIGALTNNCQIDTLYVKVNNSNGSLKDDGCIQCLAISSNPPRTSVDFTEIQRSACIAREE